MARAVRGSVGVLGAGVIGLSTAVRVQEIAGPGTSVTILADKFSPQTTSDGAAGIWEPYLLGDTPFQLQKRWGADTFHHLWRMANTPEGGEAGVFTVSGYTLFHQEVPDPHWSDTVPGFRHMTKLELQQFPKHSNGWFHTTVIAEGRFYLPWLTKRFELNGGVVQNKRITDIKEIASDYDVIVNCTGLGARDLVNDVTVSPIRGHILKLQAPWMRHFVTADEDDLYLIPCSEYTVLGGTHDVGAWETVATKTAREFILNGCRDLLPTLKHAKLKGEWVGLRPGRPSIRLEVEKMDGMKKAPTIVHNYGHGGAGITLHWGCAGDAAELVYKSLCGADAPPLAKI